MELIPYGQFGELRLHSFVTDVSAIGKTSNWEWMDSIWVNEGVGFTSFSCHESSPTETGGLEISFPDLAAESCQRLLDFIRLPLRPAMNLAEVLSTLGTPAETHRYVSGRCTCNFEVGVTYPYFVSCTVDEAKGLIYVAIIRADLLS